MLLTANKTVMQTSAKTNKKNLGVLEMFTLGLYPQLIAMTGKIGFAVTMVYL